MRTNDIVMRIREDFIKRTDKEVEALTMLKSERDRAIKILDDVLFKIMDEEMILSAWRSSAPVEVRK